jgi:membrane protease YdiL (CAAX protease family)
MIISLFEIPESIIPSADPSVPMTLLQFFLAVFTTAIVPAVCEEFLFRSTILENLLPYGKNFAIFTSALLFGLMHQTFYQIFYTTMAGLILGWAYSKTRSYLCVFLIHFCNNFISVFQEFVLSNLNEELGTLVYLLIESTVILLGAFSIIIICIKEKRKKDIYTDGSFGMLLEASDNYKEKQLSFDAAKAFFISPTVLIYTILTIATVVMQILLSFIIK